MTKEKKVKLFEGNVKKGGVNLVSDTSKMDFTPTVQQRTSSKDTEGDKIKLTYVQIPKGTFGCIPESHYDLHTDEREPENIGCILTDKEGAKLIRKWIKQHNKDIDNA